MKKINETFNCINCQKEIPIAIKTCRNHCPHCFTSLHVDSDIPGDRNTTCHGNMYPTQYFLTNWTMKILFECEKCHKTHWNKRAEDDEVAELDSLIKQYQKNLE